MLGEQGEYDQTYIVPSDYQYDRLCLYAILPAVFFTIVCTPPAHGTWCDVGWVGKQHNVDCTDSTDVRGRVPVFSCAVPESEQTN